MQLHALDTISALQQLSLQAAMRQARSAREGFNQHQEPVEPQLSQLPSSHLDFKLERLCITRGARGGHSNSRA